jgi:hypothetical protein
MTLSADLGPGVSLKERALSYKDVSGRSGLAIFGTWALILAVPIFMPWIIFRGIFRGAKVRSSDGVISIDASIIVDILTLAIMIALIVWYGPDWTAPGPPLSPYASGF